MYQEKYRCSRPRTNGCKGEYLFKEAESYEFYCPHCLEPLLGRPDYSSLDLKREPTEEQEEFPFINPADIDTEPGLRPINPIDFENFEEDDDDLFV